MIFPDVATRIIKFIYLIDGTLLRNIISAAISLTIIAVSLTVWGTFIGRGSLRALLFSPVVEAGLISLIVDIVVSRRVARALARYESGKYLSIAMPLFVPIFSLTEFTVAAVVLHALLGPEIASVIIIGNPLHYATRIFVIVILMNMIAAPVLVSYLLAIAAVMLVVLVRWGFNVWRFLMLTVFNAATSPARSPFGYFLALINVLILLTKWLHDL
jgi:hypothetical protein